jgi:hypothetical protein
MKKLVLSLIFFYKISVCVFAQTKDYTQYVNTFIGTQ